MLTWIICDSSVAQREKWRTDWMAIECCPINLPIYLIALDCWMLIYLFADIYDWVVIACCPINLPIHWIQISRADIYDCHCIGLPIYLFADIYDRVVIACYPINLPIYLMQISIADILIADIYDWMVFACCLINGQYVCCWYGIANIYGCHCFG